MENTNIQKPIIRSLDEAKPTTNSMKAPFIVFILLAFFGIGTGFLLAKTNKSTVVSSNKGAVTVSSVKKGDTFGSTDEKTFRDKAEGVLREGGIEGEGAFHLERPGGASQNVYLTSSVVDLSNFIGRKVKVWGQTNAAKRAGWLMDVGKLQVL